MRVSCLHASKWLKVYVYLLMYMRVYKCMSECQKIQIDQLNDYHGFLLKIAAVLLRLQGRRQDGIY